MKNIIFDVDDTLYDLMEPFQQAHEELFGQRFDLPCEPLFMASRTYSDEAFYMVEEGKLPSEEAFSYRIIKAYQAFGVEIKPQEAKEFEKKYRSYQKKLHLPEITKRILDYCKEKHVKIGALTNGTLENQGKKIQTLGLSHWIPEEYLFISEGVGAPKPEAKAFLAVQEKMNIHPEDTWYIGDTYEVDVEGAKSVGWHVIWYNHRHRPMPESHTRPDLEVSTGEELFEAIQEIIEG